MIQKNNMTAFEILYVNKKKQCILAMKVLKSIPSCHKIVKLDWELVDFHMELPEHWKNCQSQGIAYFVNIKNKQITCAGWDASSFGFTTFTRKRTKIPRQIIQNLCVEI